VDRIPVTREGYETLKKELENLKRVERPRNIKAIEEARAHGDLSENAEFEAAKDRQGFIEGRIGELEFKLANEIEPYSVLKYCWKILTPERKWNTSWWARMNLMS
jgi:transcription elongation factor GreA